MAIHSNQRRKRSKRNPDWKRSKTLLADDMILYIENTRDAIRTLPALINEYSKGAGHKINTQKSLGFLYTNNEKSEREIKETIPFTTKIRYFGINLPEETKHLYAENYNTLTKEIKDDTNRWIFLNWKNKCCENDYTTQSNLQIQFNPYQTSIGIIHRLEQKPCCN